MKSNFRNNSKVGDVRHRQFALCFKLPRRSTSLAFVQNRFPRINVILIKALNPFQSSMTRFSVTLQDRHEASRGSRDCFQHLPFRARPIWLGSHDEVAKWQEGAQGKQGGQHLRLGKARRPRVLLLQQQSDPQRDGSQLPHFQQVRSQRLVVEPLHIPDLRGEVDVPRENRDRRLLHVRAHAGSQAAEEPAHHPVPVRQHRHSGGTRLHQSLLHRGDPPQQEFHLDHEQVRLREHEEPHLHQFGGQQADGSEQVSFGRVTRGAFTIVELCLARYRR